MYSLKERALKWWNEHVEMLAYCVVLFLVCIQPLCSHQRCDTLHSSLAHLTQGAELFCR